MEVKTNLAVNIWRAGVFLLSQSDSRWVELGVGVVEGRVEQRWGACKTVLNCTKWGYQ